MINQAFAWKIDSRNGMVTAYINSIQPIWTSLDDITKTIPNGAYTTFRTYQHRDILYLEDHYQRLEETSRLAGHPVSLNQAALSKTIQMVLDTITQYQELRLRISIDLTQNIGDLYLSVENLTIPAPESYQNGVNVITRSMHRQNPKAKLSEFIAISSGVKTGLSKTINEVIMISEDNHLLEGLSSNFFGIINGRVWTEDKGVLSGITRKLVFEIIEDLGIPLELRGIMVEDVSRLEEAFITSTSRSVLPLRQIDETVMPLPVPGVVTSKIMARFEDKVKQHLTHF